jgi:hypothetical protein
MRAYKAQGQEPTAQKHKNHIHIGLFPFFSNLLQNTHFKIPEIK